MYAENYRIKRMLNELRRKMKKERVEEEDNIKKIIEEFHPAGASFDDMKMRRQATEAFKQALTKDEFPIVEMLYDHWCGDLHWFGHDINLLRTLGKMLQDASVVCKDKNQPLVDIQSLIKFNAFQQTLYSSISNIVPEEPALMLVEVLRIYDEYSDLEKVRILSKHAEVEQELQNLFNDNSSEYMKGQAYIKYEVYFRKLDFNVALLILENLYVLRRLLWDRFNKTESYFKDNPLIEDTYKKAVLSYNEIECALYHFIYRTSEDWRLYLPRKRHITTEEHQTSYGTLKITYDEHKLFNGPVLFLERKNFNKSLKQLRVLVETHVISADPAIVLTQTLTKKRQGCKKKDKKMSLINDNYLAPTMYMSDYFSLRKIIYYLEAIEDNKNNDVNHILMIERVLQVTGEMSKSTDQTYHLSKSTKSLLQIALSVDKLKYLQKVRTLLSKAGDEYISARIAIEKQSQMFDDIKKDLIIIKQHISLVLNIYKSIVDKSLLKKGLCLLDERIKSLPDEASKHINDIYQRYKKDEDQLFEENGTLLQQLKVDTSLTTQLLKEITWICVNRDDLIIKKQSVKTAIRDEVAGILPTYIRDVRQMLKLFHMNQNSLDFSSHWESIEETLSFFIKDCELFEPGAPIHQISFAKDLHVVTKILKELEDICKSKVQPIHSFDGIEKLHNTFNLEMAKQKNMGNTSRAVRENLIKYLISRVTRLKETLEYPKHIPLAGITPSDYHLRKYKHDKKFRFVLEMILADIGNTLAQCNIKELMNKSAKSLREIDLGNVLDHGNPFLEVIGDIFDSYDLSSGLLSKAIMFAKDGVSIEAVFELFKDNVDYQTIKEGKLYNMNVDQKAHYDLFQKSPNWESYAVLIP